MRERESASGLSSAHCLRPALIRGSVCGLPLLAHPFNGLFACLVLSRDAANREIARISHVCMYILPVFGRDTCIDWPLVSAVILRPSYPCSAKAAAGLQLAYFSALVSDGLFPALPAACLPACLSSLSLLRQERVATFETESRQKTPAAVARFAYALLAACVLSLSLPSFSRRYCCCCLVPESRCKRLITGESRALKPLSQACLLTPSVAGAAAASRAYFMLLVWQSRSGVREGRKDVHLFKLDLWARTVCRCHGQAATTPGLGQTGYPVREQLAARFGCLACASAFFASAFFASAFSLLLSLSPLRAIMIAASDGGDGGPLLAVRGRCSRPSRGEGLAGKPGPTLHWKPFILGCASPCSSRRVSSYLRPY